ncbi:MAG: DoxX family protein [Bacteroidota bacterium]
MFKQLINTDANSATLFALRIVTAITIFPHGAQKLLGWFGGYGYQGTMQYFTQTVQVPYLIGLLVILGESLGMIALFFGFASRFMGASLTIILTGASFLGGHYQRSFFMNWFGNQPGEGFEYFLPLLVCSVILALKGGGKWSIDAWLQKQLS